MSPVYSRAAELLEADINDELVALEPKAGRCFGFNAVAASVWRLLESPKSFAQIRDSLVDQYDVSPSQCEEELRELLDSMTAEGLVRFA